MKSPGYLVEVAAAQQPHAFETTHEDNAAIETPPAVPGTTPAAGAHKKYTDTNPLTRDSLCP